MRTSALVAIMPGFSENRKAGKRAVVFWATRDGRLYLWRVEDFFHSVLCTGEKKNNTGRTAADCFEKCSLEFGVERFRAKNKPSFLSCLSSLLRHSPQTNLHERDTNSTRSAAGEELSTCLCAFETSAGHQALKQKPSLSYRCSLSLPLSLFLWRTHVSQARQQLTRV